MPALLASAYLLLKILVAVLWARREPRRGADAFVTAFLTAWLLVQLGQTGIIFVLSALRLLAPTPFWLATAASAVAAAIFALRARGNPWTLPTPRKPAFWLLACMALTVVLLWVRAVFLTDFTWDAQTYGIPRIGIWMAWQSVFEHMPSRQLNLYANEWNGELNALAYGLAAAGLDGLSFANVEIFGVGLLTLAWVARQLGAHWTAAFFCALLLGATPAMIGLAVTVKGDLLACVGILMAIGFAVEASRRQDATIPKAAALAALCLATGAKIIVAPFAAVLGLYILSIRPREGLGRVLLLASAAGALFLSRFWINLLVYGNPFQRVRTEEAQLALANLTGSIALLFDHLFEMPSGAYWALTGGLGISFAACLGIFYATGLPRLRDRSHILLMFAALCTALIVLIMVPAAPWSFRYILANLLALMIVPMVQALRAEPLARSTWALAAVATLITGVNLAMVLRDGEFIPNIPLAQIADRHAQITSLERASMMIPEPYLRADTDLIGLDGAVPLDIAILNEINTSILPYVGSRAQNRIHTADSVRGLLTLLASRRHDLAVIAKPPGALGIPTADIEKLGFVAVSDNALYQTFLNADRYRVPQIDTASLQWSAWGAGASPDLSIDPARRSISSSSPVDAGLVSAPIRSDVPVLVRATFAGTINSQSGHAAHLSVHGKHMLLALPPGRYSEERPWTVLIPAHLLKEPASLSFGLGGWSKGQGDLRLTSITLLGLRPRSIAAGLPVASQLTPP
jgi:hypothetical protein